MASYSRIKDLREDKGIKQKEIAPILNTSQRQYSRWERGDQEIPLKHIITLARYYKVSMDYITGLSNNKQGGIQNWVKEEITEILNIEARKEGR